MPQKIKILRLEKPEEYKINEITVIRSFRNKLLLSTDWTQLIDNNLSVKNILEWRYWRNNVRCISVSTYDIIENSRKKLDTLDLTKPKIENKQSWQIYPMINFDYSSVENFKKTCIMILESNNKKTKAAFKKCATIEKAFNSLIGHF